MKAKINTCPLWTQLSLFESLEKSPNEEEKKSTHLDPQAQSSLLTTPDRHVPKKLDQLFPGELHENFSFSGRKRAFSSLFWGRKSRDFFSWVPGFQFWGVVRVNKRGREMGIPDAERMSSACYSTRLRPLTNLQSPSISIPSRP